MRGVGGKGCSDMGDEMNMKLVLQCSARDELKSSYHIRSDSHCHAGNEIRGQAKTKCLCVIYVRTFKS